MQIPSTLKILAHEYAVEMDPNLMLTSDSMGSCCSNVLQIKIAGGIPESNQADALLHEIIEALKYQLELPFDHRDISALAASLLSVIRDNDLDFRV